MFPFDSPWSPTVPAWGEHVVAQWQPDHDPAPMVGVTDFEAEWNVEPVLLVCYGMVRLCSLYPSKLVEDIQVHAPPNPLAEQVTGFHGTYTTVPVDICSGNREEEPDSFAVTILSRHEFAPPLESPVSGCGKFHPDFFDIIQALLVETDLTLQTSCTVNRPQPQGLQLAKPARLGPVSFRCEVSITLCGPAGRIDEVGEFFQSLDMYLQDPKNCIWDVKYCNPHRLSSLNLSDCPMTSELGCPSTEVDQAHFQQIASESDILGVFDVQQDLPEAPQPELIVPLLKR